MKTSLYSARSVIQAGCVHTTLGWDPSVEDGRVVRILTDPCFHPFFLVHSLEVIEFPKKAEVVSFSPYADPGQDVFLESIKAKLCETHHGDDRLLDGERYEVRERLPMRGPARIQALSQIDLSIPFPRGCYLRLSIENIDFCSHTFFVSALVEHP